MADLTRAYIERNCVGTPRGCWEWTGKTKRNGYPAAKRGFDLHRQVYELYVGPIPEGLVIDHLCRNRLCLNANHLKPVAKAQNEVHKYAANHGQMGRKSLRIARELHRMVGEN